MEAETGMDWLNLSTVPMDVDLRHYQRTMKMYLGLFDGFGIDDQRELHVLPFKSLLQLDVESIFPFYDITNIEGNIMLMSCCFLHISQLHSY